MAHSVVVKKHGGKIWFETETGRGYHVFHPPANQSGGRQEEELMLKRLMFVDDDALVLDGLRESFAREARRVGHPFC